MSEVKSKVPGVVDEVKAAVGDKIEKGQPGDAANLLI